METIHAFLLLSSLWNIKFEILEFWTFFDTIDTLLIKDNNDDRIQF